MKDQNQEENKQKDRASLTYAAPKEVKDAVILKRGTAIGKAGVRRVIGARPAYNFQAHVHFSHGTPGSKAEGGIPAKPSESLILVRCYANDEAAKSAGEQVGTGTEIDANHTVYNASNHSLEYVIKDGAFHAKDITETALKESKSS